MKNNEGNAVFNVSHSLNPTSIDGKVAVELCRLLFRQLPYTISAQLAAAILFLAGYHQLDPNSGLERWLIGLFLVSVFWALVTVFYYTHNHKLHNTTWLLLSGIGSLFSGVAWGYICIYHIPPDIGALQIYSFAFILGVTAGANTLLNANLTTYYSFLCASFLPFIFWQFNQGGVYFLLGLAATLFFTVMVVCCYMNNHSLRDSARLRFQNIDLDTLNQILEKRVTDRTSDLEKSLAITKSTLEATADGILVVDTNGHVEYVNQKFIEIWKLHASFAARADYKFFINLIQKRVKQSGQFLIKIEKINQAPNVVDNGEIIFKDNRVFEWYSQPHIFKGEVIGRVWSFRDMSLRKKMEHQLSYQANHDSLTGLPNRTLLYDRIEKGMLYADRFGSELVLMFLDIDNFKLINDTLGHDNGDILLKTVAERLKSCTRKSDTVARFGGDEFIVLYFTNDTANVTRMAQNILKQITKPILFSDHEIVVTTSIGVSIYPNDGVDANTLLKNADLAMYSAKNQGKNNVKMFDDSIKVQAQETLSYQIELRNSIANQELALHYQPLFDLNSLQIIGCEVLLRWQHPKEGLLYPGKFITIAEESGLINEIGSWVLKEACQQNLAWQAQGLKAINMSVNVSPVQFMRDDFFNKVMAILNQLNYPPHLLELELTESTLMERGAHTTDILRQFQKLNIGISIDDFGTGYSSLNYLKQFPVSKLKVDKSFVLDCADDENEGSIVKAIIAMGHSLNLPVVAEGVEDKGHFDFLRKCRCDIGQGFYLGKPMPACEFEKLLGHSAKVSRG